MKRTSIEWCTHSANPIKFRRADDPTGQRGAFWACVKVSAGCQNCYASTLSSRFHGRAGRFTATRMATLTPYVDDADLKAMLSPRRLPAGSKVFVEDMSDLFGEWVTDEMLDRVFAVFALRPDVVFQVLTKRPERMREYLTEETFERLESLRDDVDVERGIDPVSRRAMPWPLPNVWVGVSAEDQYQADKRIPELLATPAAVRFVSAEPLLGQLNMRQWLHDSHCWDLTVADEAEGGFRYADDDDGPCICNDPREDHISWVIVGGESGPRARPCDVAWIRAIVGQCRAAGVSVFVKQLGANPYNGGNVFGHQAVTAIPLKSRKGGEMAEWPEDLRVREMPV